MRSRRGNQVNIIVQANHLGFRDKNAMLIGPIQDLLKVSALMRNVEITLWIDESLHPIVGYHVHIAITHSDLPEHLNAVV